MIICKPYYKLTDVNNSCLYISKYKYDVITAKIKLIVNYREYKVPHLIKFLEIKKED